MALAFTSSIAGLIFGVQGYLQDWGASGVSGAITVLDVDGEKVGLAKCRSRNFVDDLSNFDLLVWILMMCKVIVSN